MHILYLCDEWSLRGGAQHHLAQVVFAFSEHSQNSPILRARRQGISTRLVVNVLDGRHVGCAGSLGKDGDRLRRERPGRGPGTSG